jgi:hypothetical protein
MAYLPTTRFEPEGETPWFTMREEHSHAVDHLVFRPEFSKLVSELHSTLVLIDDETTTGKTFWGLAAGLASVGQSPENVILVTLTDWSNGSSRGAIEAVFPEAKVTSVSLLSGRFAWKPAEGVSPRPLPSGCAPCCTKWTPRLSAPFGVPRMGIDAQKHRRETEAFLDMMSCDVLPGLSSGARILVVGTGEHVWYPFLAAERIEAAGHETRFIATTRSPVAQGPIVPNQLRFSDHYGLGLTMYLNNVRPEDWDDILLFTETGVSGIDPDLCAALGKGQIIAADAAAHAMSGELK